MKKLLYILLLSSCTPVLDSVVPTIEKPVSNRIAIADAKANTIYHLKNDVSPINGTKCWDELDMFYGLVDTTESLALTDWIDTSRHATKYGTVTFVTNGGMYGNGTNGKANTNYNPYTDGVHFTLNSNSFGVYVGNRVLENKTDLSALQTGTIGCEVQSISTSPSLYAYDNEATQRTLANDIGRGLHAVKRTGSTSWTSSVGGYLGSTFTDASTSIQNEPFWEYCRAVNTTYSKYSTRKHYYVFAGSGNIDLFLLNSIMEEYYLIPLGLAPTKRVTFLGNSYIASRTLTQDAMASLNDYNNIDLNNVGVSGYNTTQVLALAQTNVFPFQKSYLTNDVVFIVEGTNDYAYRSGNATTMYNDMVALCDSVKAHNSSVKIIVMTMPPKTGATNRQNDSNLNDTAYYNGMLRIKLVRDGHAFSICDIASDLTIGQNGQNTNTTYYKTDGIHWNATGTQYANDNYIYPSLTNAGL